MKKRTPSDFIWDNICREHREELNEKRKEKNKQKRINDNALKFVRIHGSKSGMLSSKHLGGLEKLPCPKNVCLDSNLEETIKFIKKIPNGTDKNRTLRRRSGRKSKTSKIINSYFDFESIEKICPASALIISASYFMHTLRGGTINVVKWGDWNKGVRNVLTKMGFFELLRFKEISTDESLQDFPIKGFKMGREAYTEEITKYFKRLIKKVSEISGIDKDDKLFKDTMGAIEEAVENSARHAYPKKTDKSRNPIEFPKDIHGGWWFGGMFLPEKKQIILACYDKGMSIPRSIKESHLEPKKRIMHDFVNNKMNLKYIKTGVIEINNNRDHERLEIAMEYLTSTTRNKGGGKGLSYIVKTIGGFDNGKVKIISRRAHAVITKDKDPVVTLLKTPIAGTLIIWEITL